jgi:hypothetical protein
VLPWRFGVALLLAPASFYEPTGIEMTPPLILGALFAFFLMKARKRVA